jgi:putative salt-induced outer membrane protein
MVVLFSGITHEKVPMIRHLSIMLAMLSASRLLGQDAPPPPRPFEFTGEVGLVNAAGNSEVTTLNVGEKLTHNRGNLTLRQQFALVYGRTDGTTTTSQWRTGLRGDLAMSSSLAVYGLVGFDRNRFAGVERRFEEGVGLALKLIATEGNKLDLEAGVSLTQQRSILDVSESFTAIRTAALFQHNFTAAAYVLQTIEALPNLEDSDDLRINTESALVAPLSRRLAIKVSYVIRYDKQPEPGFEKTDRLLTSGLQVTL